MTKDLSATRQQIDAIDKELVRLLEERMRCVTDVITYKLENDLPIYDASREDAVLDKVAGLVGEKSYEEAIVATFADIMKHSRDYQAAVVKAHKEGK